MFFILMLKSKKVSFTDMVGYWKKTTKAFVWHLMSMEELENCGLRFRAFKPANTLTLDALKGEKKQISYKEGT